MSSDMATALLSSSSSSSSSSFGGHDSTADEDGCSICLEPFTSLHPASVTKCKHEYHLQCILEWSLRSSQCPVCLQHLVLNDPSSQEMVAEAERNNKWATTKRSNHENEFFQYTIPRSRDSDHERLMRRRVAAAAAAASARMIMIARRRRPSTNPEQFHFFSTADSSPSAADSRSRSIKFMAFSGSLKAKLSTASLRYKESFSRGTRSLKAKILARKDSVKELSRGVQREMSAGIARLISRKPSAREASLTSSVDGEDSIVYSLLPMSSNSA